MPDFFVVIIWETFCGHSIIFKCQSLSKCILIFFNKITQKMHATSSKNSRNSLLAGCTIKVSIWFLESIIFENILVRFSWYFGHFFTMWSHVRDTVFAFVKTMDENEIPVLIKDCFLVKKKIIPKIDLWKLWQICFPKT